MPTMSQGAQGAHLASLGRRLLSIALISDLVELVGCGTPIVLWLRSVPYGSLLLQVSLPLTLAALAAVELRAGSRLGPVLRLAQTVRSGAKVRAEETSPARAALSKAPGEAMVSHVLIWAAVATAATWRAWRCAQGALPAAALVELVLVTTVGLTALRIWAFRLAVGPVQPVLVPNVQGIRTLADGYRGDILAIAIAIVGIWQAVLAFFLRFSVGMTAPALTLGMFAMWPGLIVGALLWWHAVLRKTGPIEQYFDLAVRSKGKGLGRADQSAVHAFVAAERVPYGLAMVEALTLAASGSSGVVLLLARGGLGRSMAGRALLLIMVLSLLALCYGLLLRQRVLRPLLSHLGARHALPLDQVRAPLGLRGKLGGAMGSLLLASAIFVWLCASAAEPGRIVTLALAMVLLSGMAMLLIRSIVAPLETLEERSSEMAKGQLARPVPPWGEADEAGRLAFIFEEMRRSLRDRLRSTESINVDLEREVRRRTEALEQRNAELRDAIEKLRRAQDNLIRTEKLASMGRLVAGIAHEINNPVNAVINSLGPLADLVRQVLVTAGSTEKLASETEEILAVVQRGAARTKAIVQALHGYARGDESVKREVSLARSIDETLGLLQHRLRHVKVTRSVDDGVSIMGFPGQIDQVLMNLFTNAAQAIGPQGGAITVSARRQDERVLLTVADDGAGIPPDVLPHIFDPFFTTKDVGEGSGLGLSIVHGIVDRHGGNIEVESEVGRGTRFSLSFPLFAAARAG
jgi:signal transduction histidine kinase